MTLPIAPLLPLASLLREAGGLRARLDSAFAPDTKFPGSPEFPPSAGHCAAVAVIVCLRLGGQLASTDNQGHWFNRLMTEDGEVDLDLTGDQFGRGKIEVEAAGELFPGTQPQQLSEINEETWRRVRLLAARADIALPSAS